jgi:hypothetical protein
MALKGPDGRFIEDGVGSPAHLTANHLAALERSKGGVPGAADFEALLGVVHDSADDKATKARVQALQTAAADARQATAKAERETKALDAKRVEHLRLMAAEKEKFDAYVDARREEIEVEAATKLKDVLEREAAVKRREEEVAGLIRGHSERVAELDAKLAAIAKAAR